MPLERGIFYLRVKNHIPPFLLQRRAPMDAITRACLEGGDSYLLRMVDSLACFFDTSRAGQREEGLRISVTRDSFKGYCQRQL
jgi:hypothetical protein